MADSPGKWITVREAIVYLGLSERTIRRRIKAGELTTRETKKGVLIYLGDAPTGNRLNDATGTPQAGEARPQAYIQQLQAEVTELREQLDQAERWEQTAERLAQEGQELWDQWSQTQGELREWKARAEELRHSRDYLEQTLANAQALLMASQQKLIEAQASEPRRHWWKFWG